MTVRLLDANVLIALVVKEHEHHEHVNRWTTGVEQMALCPIVEGALLRFLLRTGVAHESGLEVLRGLYRSGRFEFWPDDVSFDRIDLEKVVGHRQVTDVYLAGLALSRDAILATLDRALAETRPKVTEFIGIRPPS